MSWRAACGRSGRNTGVFYKRDRTHRRPASLGLRKDYRGRVAAETLRSACPHAGTRCKQLAAGTSAFASHRPESKPSMIVLFAVTAAPSAGFAPMRLAEVRFAGVRAPFTAIDYIRNLRYRPMARRSAS